VRQEFVTALRSNEYAFDIKLFDDAIERLADYYELIQEHNSVLHLVAPCSPDEFAIRHILESLALLKHLPQDGKFADVGTGAGLPSIPCLLVRTDLQAVLIESKEKKASFLREVKDRLDLSGRVEIVNNQFEEVDPSECEFVTCRALDKFITKLPRLIKWSKNANCLFFGGPSLRAALQDCGMMFDEHLLPISKQRYLFTFSQRKNGHRISP